jgi:flagellin-like hook-associated protein FlgL
MVSSAMDSLSANISSIYNQNGNDLASVMSKIAAGKKWGSQPSDDFVAYLKTTSLQSDVAQYQNTSENIAQAKVYTDAAKAAGNTLYGDLVKLQNLSVEWGAASGTDKAAIGNQYDTLLNTINNFAANAEINGQKIFGGGVLTSVSLSPGGTAVDITSATAPDATGLATGGDASLIVADALTFLSDMQALGKTLENQSNLTNTIIASKNSAITAVSGIDDAAMLAQETDLQVRQQAAISMLSQANISRAAISKLFS